jgi:hypothetical protein
VIPLTRTSELLNCCRLAEKALLADPKAKMTIFPGKWEEFLLGRIPDWPKDTFDLQVEPDDLTNTIKVPFFHKTFQFPSWQLLILTAAGLMYGGLHYGFKLEQNLPRSVQILSRVPTITLLVMAVMFFLTTVLTWRFADELRDHHGKWWFTLLSRFLIVVYVGAKITMFAGCCASLHNLSPGVVKATQPLPWMR